MSHLNIAKHCWIILLQLRVFRKENKLGVVWPSHLTYAPTNPYRLHFRRISKLDVIISPRAEIFIPTNVNSPIYTPIMTLDVEKALSLIDAAHGEDPNKIDVDGNPVPYELHYARKMTQYLNLHTPDSDPLLTVAVRAQHFRRWEVPRDSYPRTKVGYFAWRVFLKKRQADQVKELCLQSQASEEEAGKVASLIAKEDLKKGEGQGDPEAQILEDVACLVFLDDQFDQFEKEHDEEKIISILKKTWLKMGKRGQDLALEMDLSPRAKELVSKALAG